MFQKTNLDGTTLKKGELCLTFDDGPGNDTAEIAEFLHQNGIRATFFVVGKFAAERIDVLKKIAEYGHIIGNHTFEHPDLPYYCSVDGDVQDQIIRTHAVIQEYIPGKTVFFRAPYGKWSAEVADELNSNLLSTIGYVGPVHWEIPGIDCYYWSLGKTPEEACEEYKRNIELAGKGIVVMHDEIADMDVVKEKNRTLELVKLLIPELLNLGYTFVGLDEIQAMKVEAGNAWQMTLLNAKSRKFAIRNDELIINKINSGDAYSTFRFHDEGYGKVRLTSADGKILSLRPDRNEEVFLSESADKYSLFDFIQVRNHSFMLRSFTGKYLNVNREGVLAAAEPFMRKAEIFRFSTSEFNSYRPKSRKNAFQMFIKSLKFIRSKIFQA